MCLYADTSKCGELVGCLKPESRIPDAENSQARHVMILRTLTALLCTMATVRAAGAAELLQLAVLVSRVSIAQALDRFEVFESTAYDELSSFSKS